MSSIKPALENHHMDFMSEPAPPLVSRLLYGGGINFGIFINWILELTEELLSDNIEFVDNFVCTLADCQVIATCSAILLSWHWSWMV